MNIQQAKNYLQKIKDIELEENQIIIWQGCKIFQDDIQPDNSLFETDAEIIELDEFNEASLEVYLGGFYVVETTYRQIEMDSEV